MSNVIDPPEMRASSQLLEELRQIIADPKYDNLSVSELIGVLEMVKFEHLKKWND